MVSSNNVFVAATGVTDGELCCAGCATPRTGPPPTRCRCGRCRGRCARVTVNLVIVSHSAQLAEGTAELARQMGGDEVAIEPAGGLDDGSIGTDAERVRAAIERVRSPDGVLVLMDLGSALMSAEIAVELLEEDGGPVALSGAPLVEGAVARRARARGGAELAEVATEARGALAMKTSQLEEETPRRRPRGGWRTAEGSSSGCPSATASACTCARPGGIIELVATTTRRSSCATRPAGPARPTAAA